MSFNILPPFKIPDDAVMSPCLGFLSSQGMRWCFKVCICSAALALLLVHQSDISELSACACLRLCDHPPASCVLGLVENESIISRPQRSNACYKDAVTMWARTAVSKSQKNFIIANWWRLSDTTNLWKSWSLAPADWGYIPAISCDAPEMETFCSSNKRIGWKGTVGNRYNDIT